MTVGQRLRELAGYRELVLNLTVRDLKLKYKRSTLGVAWSLLNPIFMMVVYTAIFSVFLRVVTLPHYWALVVGGLLAWTFFATGLQACTVSFAHGAGLITKVYFPIESLPISTVLANFFNFAISLAVLVVVLLVVHLPLGASLVLLPVIVLAQLALGLGLGLLVASITVYFRDLEHLIVLGLTAWFYVTPIIYPLDPHALPGGAVKYIPYIKLNPLSWYLESYHAVLYYGTWPDPVLFALMLVSAVVAVVSGYLLFARVRPRLPEEI